MPDSMIGDLAYAGLIVGIIAVCVVAAALLLWSFMHLPRWFDR